MRFSHTLTPFHWAKFTNIYSKDPKAHTVMEALSLGCLKSRMVHVLGSSSRIQGLLFDRQSAVGEDKWLLCLKGGFPRRPTLPVIRLLPLPALSCGLTCLLYFSQLVSSLQSS